MVYGNCLECGGHAEKGEDLCWRCMEADAEEEELLKRDEDDTQSGADRVPGEPLFPTSWVFMDEETTS